MSTVPTIICTPCLRNDETVDAVKYCADCNENFCRVCLRKHIKEFVSVSKQHRLLNREEMPEWLSSPVGREGNFCTRHTSNQLDSYCQDHDLVCCGACVVLEHSLCENVRDLVPILDEAEPKSETDLLLQDLKCVTDSLKALQESRRKDQSLLRKSTAKALANVRDFRRKVNDIVDKLEKRAVEDIDTECIKEDNIIESDIKQIDHSVTVLEMAIKQIRDVAEHTDVPLVEANLNIINGRKLLKDISHVQQVISEKSLKLVNFQVNKSVLKYLSALESIGTCTKKSDGNPKMSVSVTKCSIDVGDVTSFDFLDIKQTESGTFLVVDSENKRIRQLDESLKTTKTYDLVVKTTNETTDKYTYEPFAICCLTESRIAVTIPRDKVVRLYDINEMLEQVIEINVGEYCRGLAYNLEEEEVYVACGGGSYTGESLGHIRVYSLQGELLRSFKQTRDGKILSPRPMHLAIDNYCSKLYIADAVRGVIAIDTEGRVLSMFSAPELEDSRGICIDVNDHVIVCGYSSNAVLRLHGDMKGYDILLTEENGIQNPQALCYDAKLSKCVLTTSSSNELCVFDV